MVVTGQKGKWIKMRHCCDTVACGVEAFTRLPLFQDLPSDFQPEQVQVLSGLVMSGLVQVSPGLAIEQAEQWAIIQQTQIMRKMHHK